MHVSLVTETYPPEINGVALTLHTLATGLQRSGIATSLIRPRQPGEAPGASRHATTELLVPGARLPRYRELRFGWPTVGRIREYWQRQRPDAVYVATEGPLGWAALRAARTLGIPAATGFHTRFDDYFGHYGLKLLTPLVFRWLRRFHNSAQATIVPTRELQEFLTANGFHNVVRVSRAVDTVRFDPRHRDPALRSQWGVGPDDPVLLNVGRLAPEKNLDLAVRAWRAAASAAPGTRLVVVGDGPERERLQRELPEAVFPGKLIGEDLSRHYASADIFVFPSLSETFGNVTLEAMASGLAVVAFDYGAAREQIITSALGSAIAVDDPEGFVAATVARARDICASRRIGTAARAAMKQQFDGDLSERFASVLHDLRMDKAA